MGTPELAAQALALSVEEWGNIGLDNGDPETSLTSDLTVLVERVTSLLLIRVVAIVAHSGEYSDLSTSMITRTALMRQEPWCQPITENVIGQLRSFVNSILSFYNDVPYHGRDHAFHVVLSCNKLMDMFLQQKQTKTFGLRQDPLLLFSLLFSALIHDVEHQGIPNRQQVTEGCRLALLYNDQSIAENRSLYVGFSEFLKEDYKELRQVIFSGQGVSGSSPLAANSVASSPYHRFRAQVISLLLTTDIASPERSQIVTAKYKEAFADRQESAVDSKKDESSSVSDSTLHVEECRGDNVSGKEVEEKEAALPKCTPLQARRDRHRDYSVRSDEQKSLQLDQTSMPGTTMPARQRFGMRRSMDLSGESLEIYRQAPAASSGGEEPDELKASVVLELILTAADVAHNLQGFEQMVKWSDKLYMELRRAFLMGRGSDPEKNWFTNQIGFLDFYLMPLALRLENIGVFGYYGKIFAASVTSNKEKWIQMGQKVTDDVVAMGRQAKLEDFDKTRELDTCDESTSSDEASSGTPVVPFKDTASPSVPLTSMSFVASLLFVLLAVGLQVTHLKLSLPITRGKHLPNGTWLIKCGIVPSFLTGCNNAYFNVDSKGFATLYNARYGVEWEMAGAVCNKSDAHCLDGLIMIDDRKIKIGGKAIENLDMYGDSGALSPWPFAYEPDVGTRVART